MTDVSTKPFIALAIDYGTRNIGVAVGQSLTATASELPALRHNNSHAGYRAINEHINKIIAEWKPAMIVIGWPLNMDGTESPMCEEVKRFGSTLSKSTGKPVCYFDERLTSHEAKADVDDQQRNYKKQPIDSKAAKILLESWFRQQGTQ